MSHTMRRRLLRSTTHAIAAVGIVVLALAAFVDGTNAQSNGAPQQAFRDPPPDASDRGPNSTVTAEYRLPAALDTEVISDRVTEVWARVYRPDPLPDNSPLLVFLHGNHATCGRCITGMLDADGHCDDGSARHDDRTDYTSTGVCPALYVPSPSHVGYTYLADQLASWGYVVVSINVNRGINAGGGIAGDGGLNLTRGRMVLRHLTLLSRWNRGLDPTPPSLGIDLTGKLDFSGIGLLGHSRGGEGMRAALQQYRDAGSIWPDPNSHIGPATFTSIVEIGPVDGQTSRVLTPDNTDWEVLLPMCDGDVSNLQGIKPYDRVRYVFTDNPATGKGNSTVYGANHNYFNSEWQQSDSSGCTGPSNPRIFNPALTGSPEQQQVAKSLAMAMFRGTVGPDAFAPFLDIFDPLYTPTDQLAMATRVDRGFTFSPSSTVSLVLEDFTNLATFAQSNLASFAVGSLSEHDAARRVGLVTWNNPSDTASLQSNFASGVVDVSGYSMVEFDVDRQQNPLNPASGTNFHVQLVQGDGTPSDPVSASSYANIDGPQGGPSGNVHAMLNTARIPIGDFTNVDLTQIAGVLFTFDDTTSGAIFLSTIAVDAAPPPGMIASAVKSYTSSPNSAPTAPQVHPTGNRIGGLTAADSTELGRVVLLDLGSDSPFRVSNELLVVKVGNSEFDLVEFVGGDTHQLRVIIPRSQFDGLADGSRILVQYGHGEVASETWEFPALDKSALK